MAIPTTLLERDEPQAQDLRLVLGDTFRWQAAVTLDGVAQDLTGCSVRGKILDADGGTQLVAFTGSVPSPASGVVLLTLTPAQTGALTPPTSDGGQIGVYDVEIYDGTDVVTVVRGAVFALKQRTTP
jgi:hypothetical protein